MIPSVTFQTLFRSLATDIAFLTISSRLQWLEDAGIGYLNPQLFFDTAPEAFVAQLLRVAVEYDQKHGLGDQTLRDMLTYWRSVRDGQQEIVDLVTNILGEGDLAATLFPHGFGSDSKSVTTALALFNVLPTDHIPPNCFLPVPNNIRFYQNPNFVGRTTELRAITVAVKTGTGGAIAVGIGGVGKTQLVVEWVHRYGQYFTGGVFWLDFQSYETARLSIAAAGEAYEWDYYMALDQDQRIAHVRREWQKPIPTLLVFDNCEDISLAKTFLPIGSGTKVLITSRNQTWSNKAYIQGFAQVLIEPLMRCDSVTLLQNLCSELVGTEANQIADLLGDLPLALHIAGSYLAEYVGTSYGDPISYILQLKSRLFEELDENVIWCPDELPTGHEASVRATFMVSMERLNKRAVAGEILAQDILLFLAHLAPGILVPQSWVQKVFAQDADPRLIVNATKMLLATGLIDISKSHFVRVHRLIAQVALAFTENKHWSAITIYCEELLFKEAPVFGELEFIQAMEVWLPHARHVSKVALSRRDESSSVFANMLQDRLKQVALYSEAIYFCKEALLIRQSIFGVRHLSSADSLNNLAGLYQLQGDYIYALALYKEALNIREEVLGENHPDTASTLNSIGLLHQILGEYERALPLYQKALAIFKESLGMNSSSTAISLNNLGYLYQAQGDYEKALPLFEQALAIQTAIVGANHPDTARSLNNLGYLYSVQGECQRAMPLYEAALTIRQETLGMYHPDTARSLNNLGYLCCIQGEYERAIQFYEMALAVRKEMLGSNHPDTATSLNNLASLYERRGNLKHALPLFEESLIIVSAKFPSDHPTVKKVRKNRDRCRQQVQVITEVEL